MITLTDIKTSCNNLMRSTFPDIQIYNNDTHDGYIRPAFFTEMLLKAYNPLSRYQRTDGCTYKVTLLETTHDEALCLDIVDKIRNAFGLYVRVNGKRVVVEDIDFDWIDTNNDTLQVTINFVNQITIGGRVEEGDLIQNLQMPVDAIDENGGHNVIGNDDTERE